MNTIQVQRGDSVRICVNGFRVTPGVGLPGRVLPCIWTVENILPASGAMPARLALTRPVLGLSGEKIATVTTQAVSWVRVIPELEALREQARTMGEARILILLTDSCYMLVTDTGNWQLEPGDVVIYRGEGRHA